MSITVSVDAKRSLAETKGVNYYIQRLQSN